MYFNNAQCDVYIGTGAGKKLMAEIASAKVSVKVVSPFLSAKLVRGLVELHDRGIQVELVTTEPELGNRAALRDLFQENVHNDRRAAYQRKTLSRILWACYFLIYIGLVATWIFFIQKEVSTLLYSLVCSGLLGTAILVLKHIAGPKRAVSYSYSTIFPLRVSKQFDALGQRSTYLHGKIYIIDDRIAYLGSLNFTRSGTEYNYETRVRLTDKDYVDKIVEEFRHLMNGPLFAQTDHDVFG